MNKFSFFLRSVVIGCAVVLAAAPAAEAAPKKSFKVAWSIYVGWMPWGYAADTGIVKKWADKYGITIEVKQFNDYVESINQYTAGGYDAVTITNMDALSIPAAGGVDTTAVVMGDFSNGNDAVILKNKSDLAAIKGQTVNLVEFSVSHYLLARALETSKLSEKDVKVVNTSDADIAAAYKTPDVNAVVTWNPIVTEILGSPDARKVFDSSQIPGEIMDLMVVNTAVAKDNPDFAKALVGIWYETLSRMTANDPAAKAAKEAMAKPPAPTSPVSTASSRPQNCSTRQPTPKLLRAARRSGRRWTGSVNSCSKRTCSARARSRPTPSASSSPTSRCSATSRTSSCASTRPSWTKPPRASSEGRP